jgi:hypothetical protein
MIFEQTVTIPENHKLHLDLELPSAKSIGIACLKLIPVPPAVMLLSETFLVKAWDTPGEDATWELL